MAVQLAGCEPEVMAEAAKLNEDRGAALIDINFGCPVKKVVNGHAGSALMRDEMHAARILEATVKAVKLPVTLEDAHGLGRMPTATRRGWPASPQDCGIRMITVHGRTRCQFYDGTADWAFVREVKEAVRIPVIVNGDIIDMAACTPGAGGIRRRWRDDRARQLWPALVPAAGDPLSAHGRDAARSHRSSRTACRGARALRCDAEPLRHRPPACASRASISAGTARACRPRRSFAPPSTGSTSRKPRKRPSTPSTGRWSRGWPPDVRHRPGAGLSAAGRAFAGRHRWQSAAAIPAAAGAGPGPGGPDPLRQRGRGPVPGRGAAGAPAAGFLSRGLSAVHLARPGPRPRGQRRRPRDGGGNAGPGTPPHRRRCGAARRSRGLAVADPAGALLHRPAGRGADPPRRDPCHGDARGRSGP